MTCWVDSEPLGGYRWRTVVSGVCDRRALRRLMDEGRAMALLGAQEIDISLAGVDHLDHGGAIALNELRKSLAAFGITVRIGGALGAAADLLRSPDDARAPAHRSAKGS